MLKKQKNERLKDKITDTVTRIKKNMPLKGRVYERATEFYRDRAVKEKRLPIWLSKDFNSLLGLARLEEAKH